MATMNRISNLYNEFYRAACNELNNAYELLDLQNDGGNWIVVVPNKTASWRLHKWFDNNRRPNDSLEELNAAAAINLMLEKSQGGWSWNVEHGCEFLEY